MLASRWNYSKRLRGIRVKMLYLVVEMKLFGKIFSSGPLPLFITISRHTARLDSLRSI